MSVREEPLPPIRRGKFSYGSQGLTVKKSHKVDSTRLRELLFPEGIKGKRAQKKAFKDAKKIVKKDWLLAQLTHYDINHETTGSVSRLTEVLKIAVQNGKVRSPVVVHNVSSIQG